VKTTCCAVLLSLLFATNLDGAGHPKSYAFGVFGFSLGESLQPNFTASYTIFNLFYMMYSPPPVMLLRIIEEAQNVSDRIAREGLGGMSVATGPGPLPLLGHIPVMALGAAHAGLLPAPGGGALVPAAPPPARAGPGGRADGAGAAPVAAGGLGFDGVLPADDANALADLLAQIQVDMKQMKEDKKDKKKKKKKKKKSRKDRSRGRRGRDSDSSSGSRSRSQSSSSGSSVEFLQWKPHGKDRSVAPKQLRALEAQRFKARGELLTFAAKHPGALSAHFLQIVHQRMMHGPLKRTKQLRDVNVSQWAASSTGLTEVRDLREVATLAAVMDYINSRDLGTAMDIIAQRVVAIQKAKSTGSDWKKAEALELVTQSGNSALPSGMLRLVQ
jgi:hypothetical protein